MSTEDLSCDGAGIGARHHKDAITWAVDASGHGSCFCDFSIRLVYQLLALAI